MFTIAEEPIQIDAIAEDCGLLAHHHNHQSVTNDTTQPHNETTDTAILKSVVFTALPMTASQLLFFSNQAITMMFVGNFLGTDMLAAYTMALSVFNVSGQSLAVGFLACLDTLCSQAYGRNPQGTEVSLWMQRGMLVGTMMATLLGLLFIILGPILKPIFPSDIGEPVVLFLRYMVAYLIISIVNISMRRGLQSQGLAKASTLAQAISVLVCVPLNYFLVPYGVGGICISLTVSSLAGTAVFVCFGCFHKEAVIFRRIPWREVAQRDGLITLCKLGIPTLVAVCADWWSFEALNFLMVRFGTTVLGALGVSLNVMFLLIATPNSVGQAASVLVGKALGQNNVALAKRTVRYSACVFSVVITIDVVFLLFFSRVLFELYSSDEKIHNMLQQSVVAIALFHVGDNVQLFFSCLYRGVGRQSLLPKACLIAFWLLCLPFSVFFCYVLFPGRELFGALFGFCMGHVFLVSVMGGMMWSWDWVLLA
eukprot:PhF_6_TR31405/c0_g1_i3/m.46025/K03327/TC.MATE, SLC47A, norM, mdtK, dinF; multidrug resistance protein, MATE family